MPDGIGQSRWSEQPRCWMTGCTNVPEGNALGKKVPDRWHSRPEEQARDVRKRNISTKEDKETVREAIRQHRQSVSKARAAWEEATGKQIKNGAFRNFLSAMAQDLDV